MHMKTLLAISFILIAFSAQSQVLDEQDGNEYLKSVLALKMDQMNRYVLHYGKQPPGVVKVKILDSNDKIVHHEIIRHHGAFSRPYNLSMMPTDEYRFEVTEDDSTYYLSIYKPTDVDKNYIRYTNVRSLRDDKYILSVANNLTNKIMIRIFNTEGDLLFSEIETMDLQFSKMYNLSEFNYETYVFEVIDKYGVLNRTETKN